MISGAHQTNEEQVRPDPESEGRNRRRSDRIPSDASAIARIPASPHRVTLIDVSRTGCQVRIAGGVAVPVGSTVHLEFGPGRRLTGMVMWSGPRTAGIRFAHAISGPLASALGVEPAATVEIEDVPEPPTPPARKLPHWLRRILRGPT